jgi:pyridoxal phosphate enzyme (YggS family)
VAVTKTVGADRIREAIAAGVTDIGENYLQEAQEKWLELREAARWHFIGHLQRNKVKPAVEFFDVIQSVDSLVLAAEIGRRALAAERHVDVLIEVNAAGEEQKFGVTPDRALDLAGEVAGVEGIRLRGFMGMTPFVDDPELTRPYLAKLRSLFERLPPEHRAHLSMGMTQDYEVAIEEGATMVRIGTAIFGPS